MNRGLLDLQRFTGHRYRDLEAFLADAPEAVQRDLVRLARDVDDESRTRSQRAQRELGRRP